MLVNICTAGTPLPTIESGYSMYALWTQLVHKELIIELINYA